MISFIQQILQKHHKWIFSILLGVIIVAFVFTIGATPGIVGKKKTAMFYGINLLSKKDTQPIVNSAIISSFSAGNVFYSKGQLDSAVLMRIALLAKADELLIPEANDEVLSKFIKTIPMFHDDSGEFSQDKYQNFLDICAKYGFSKHEIRQSLIDDQRINIVGRTVAGNGYFSEQQLRTLLTVFYSDYDILVGELNYDSFKSSDAATEDELKTFYDQHAGRYNMPAMFAVSIVRFDANKLKAKIDLPNREELKKFFEANKSKFEKHDSFDDAYDDVVKEYSSLAMRKLANERADSFVCELYNQDIQLNTDEFRQLLNKFGATKEKVAAYSRLKFPVVDGVPEAALWKVFELDPARYYTDPFSTDFGAAVLFVEGRKDARSLSFDEAKSYVKKDVIESRKSARFKDFVDDLKVALSQLPSEKQLTEKFKKNDIASQKYENVSLSKDPKAIPAEYWESLGELSKNERVGVARRGENDVSFIVVLKRDTPKMAGMLERNGDKFKKQLLRANREFELVEYAQWLVQQELTKLK